MNKDHTQNIYRTGPEDVFILRDGIRGHDNQSAGIAWWLNQLAGSSIVEIATPRLSGYERFLRLKIMVQSIRGGNRKACSHWLEGAGGNPILETVQGKMRRTGSRPEEVLFLSTGSSAAPFCFALAKITGARCACIMTPSFLGTGPFDFAIVPEHDSPKPSANLLKTLGAPNMMRSELLEAEAAKLAARFPSDVKKRWALLLGGDDHNYRLTPEWVKRRVPPLLEDAERVGAVVYITTSRRTSPETEQALVEITENRRTVHVLILASRKNWNPVPGMLGLCQRVFCTEDSVSMISEAATAGHLVQILRVGKKGGPRKTLQDLTAKMVGINLLAPKRMWGVPRFDLMIESFCSKGFAEVYDPARQSGTVSIPESRGGNTSLNEARRAAEWIIQRWNT